MPTQVSYHAEQGSPARPAINVKVHAAGLDFWPDELAHLVAADPPWGTSRAKIGGTTVNDLVDAAYARVQSDFWQAAEEIATQRGLGDIAQEGRSGGWLVFTDGRDPQYMSGGENRDPADEDPSDSYVAAAIAERAEWLAAYAAMVEWAERFIADAPHKVRNLAQDMAMDEAGESAARRMFATFRAVAS